MKLSTHKLNLKIAVICANFGGYDNCATQINHICDYNVFDWYYISDTNVNCNEWKLCNNFTYHINAVPSALNNDFNRMYSKYYKAQSINIDIFKTYNYIIWIDASFIIQNINFVNDILKLISTTDNKIFLFEHSQRNNIKDEYLESYKLQKYKNQDLLRQITKYYKNGYTEGLYENGFIIYKNCDEIKELMNDWWNEIIIYSYQCQISLAYILYKYKIKIKLLNEPSFIKGTECGFASRGSIWNNKLIGYVRCHI